MHETAELGDVHLLGGIIGRETGERFDVAVNLCDGMIVGREILGIAGEQKAALAGFGIEQERLSLLQFEQYLSAVNRPILIFNLDADPAAGENGVANEQDHQKGESIGDAELPKKGLHKSCAVKNQANQGAFRSVVPAVSAAVWLALPIRGSCIRVRSSAEAGGEVSLSGAETMPSTGTLLRRARSLPGREKNPQGTALKRTEKSRDTAPS